MNGLVSICVALVGVMLAFLAYVLVLVLFFFLLVLVFTIGLDLGYWLFDVSGGML